MEKEGLFYRIKQLPPFPWQSAGKYDRLGIACKGLQNLTGGRNHEKICM